MKLSKKSVWFLLLTVLLLSCSEISRPEIEEKILKEIPGEVLFLADTSGTLQLYSMTLEGKDIRQITNDPEKPIMDAVWSPNGKKIAITVYMQKYHFYGGIIYVMDADGSNLQRVTLHEEAGEYFAVGHFPVWSNDSRKIAYSKIIIPEMYGNFDIFVADLSDGTEKRLTNTINNFDVPRDWNPRNDKIISDMHFTTRDTSGNEIRARVIRIMTEDGETVDSIYSNSLKTSYPFFLNERECVYSEYENGKRYFVIYDLVNEKPNQKREMFQQQSDWGFGIKSLNKTSDKALLALWVGPNGLKQDYYQYDIPSEAVKKIPLPEWAYSINSINW